MTGPMRDRRGPRKGPTKRPPKGRAPRKVPPKRAFSFWIVVILVLFFGFQLLMMDQRQEQQINYTTFMQQVDSGNIAQIIQNGQTIQGKLIEKQTLQVLDGSHQDVQQFVVTLLTIDPKLPDYIRENNPDADLQGKKDSFNIWDAILGYLPFILLLGIWLFFLRQMQGGGNKAFSFGKSKARLLNADRPQVTFADVAGCDEAKVDLEEIIEFLKSPRKFQRLGGRIPKGALLVGAPGTGKTLLAKAVAGEAAVPFFTMSGSDFVEMFVGVGASRVRDLFDQGKKSAPCIIFIDEIDAVGRHRGAGLGGGHDEREQTLNQLLVEMDGFETNEGVILLAATNRPDVLDPALLRPGRFDRTITVDMPDLLGREGILKVHINKITIGNDVDIKKLARGTPGMAGADLANLVNEGALLAARRNHEEVTMDDLEDAKERVMLGPERRALIMPEEERRRTAFHESGHAIIGATLPECDPVHKVTIIPRGQALGLTFSLPEEDRYQITRSRAISTITMAMGGRSAEELIFPEVGAGAAGDIQQATRLARNMITRWGMSEKLGPVDFAESQEHVFLGREIAQRKSISQKTATTIDEEIFSIITTCAQQARAILTEKKEALMIMAEALLERETLEGDEVRMILDTGALPPMKTPEATASPEDEEPAQEDEPAESDAVPAGDEEAPPTPPSS